MRRFNREEKPATFAKAKEILSSSSLFKTASSRAVESDLLDYDIVQENSKHKHRDLIPSWRFYHANMHF
ncbi:hypothetical protein P5673_003008 [Acropora cervicornis]|uniref:Uncharacterized protein n=1 Tax=Acropora cervicornis TaxID=6130 RepID=A0AAD9R2P4_ACRCE|nr:hypothetical protein P5673_003008 [Acropora cervicornis]